MSTSTYTHVDSAAAAMVAAFERKTRDNGLGARSSQASWRPVLQRRA
jgi:hypothetical protein